MDKYRIIFLFDKLLKEDFSASEEAEFREFVADPENEVQFKLLLGEAFEEEKINRTLDPQKREHILHRIQSHRRKSTESRSSKHYWYPAVAACILMLLMAYGAYTWLVNKGEATGQATLFSAMQPDDSMAGVSMYSGLTEINLDALAIGTLFTIGGVEVLKESANRIHYTGRGVPTSTPKVVIPIGRHYEVTLPDSSSVLLNACSSLTIDFDANLTRRIVSLSGEAYFDVKSRHLAGASSIPFVVKARGQSITVLGTQFNVSAYADDSSVKTTLVRGKVRFNETSLSPGEQLVFSARGKVVSQVNVRQVAAWKDGHFAFYDEDIRSIMRQLARWYPVSVSFAGGGHFHRAVRGRHCKK